MVELPCRRPHMLQAFSISCTEAKRWEEIAAARQRQGLDMEDEEVGEATLVQVVAEKWKGKVTAWYAKYRAKKAEREKLQAAKAKEGERPQSSQFSPGTAQSSSSWRVGGGRDSTKKNYEKGGRWKT